MPQLKITLQQANLDFVSHYQDYGYESKSAMVETAIAELEKKLESQRILDSAQLYAEIYREDEELQQLTDDAASLCLE